MSLVFFAVKNNYYKNGIWWFTKVLNRAVGQQNYQSLRISRRVLQNKIYYIRQHMLYRCFIQSPDLANLLGVYPKTDSSHGYGSNIHYEMYRDFQENTISSDGSFGMWVALISAIYLFHVIYSYFIPWYWNKTASCKNGEEERIRMRDALASTNLEDSTGFSFLQWGFNPHYTYHVKHKLTQGLSHPDDVRAMGCSGLNRRNRYREHYTDSKNHKMIGSF